MIKNETGVIEIVLFSSLVDELSNNTSYDFEKMRVQKFMNDRILKSTETTKVSKNDDVAIFVTDEGLSSFSYEKTLKVEFVSVDVKTMTQTYLCPVCRASVSIINAVAWWKRCDNASLQSQCKSKADVKMIILNESGQFYHQCATRFNRKIYQFGSFTYTQKGYCYETYKQIFYFYSQQKKQMFGYVPLNRYYLGIVFKFCFRQI